MKYAGIGARKTPKNILDEMTLIAAFLEKFGYTLRSGAAGGADSAFERGVSSSSNCEIFLPWRKFSQHNSKLFKPSKEAYDIAEEFHPYWRRLSDTVKKLMARNSHQVLGADLKELSDFVVCWTPDGKASGGTGQAIRIANATSVPVYNLFNDSDRNELRELLKTIKKEFLADKEEPAFTKHIQAECFEPETCGGMCYGCCLAICKVCKGGEGELTTHCPGIPLTKEQQEAQFCQKYDYTQDAGWHELTNTLGEHMYRTPVFEK